MGLVNELVEWLFQPVTTIFKLIFGLFSGIAGTKATEINPTPQLSEIVHPGEHGVQSKKEQTSPT
jgi:hypothetical protein